MLDALVSGTTDPEILADLARGKLRKKIPALKEALEGRFDHLHAVWIGAILAHLDFLDEQISNLTEAIGEQIAPFEKAVELLCTIPGIQRRNAECIIAEIGLDMSVFPTAKQLASWAGQCPGNDQSAGKRRSGQSRKGSKWLDWALEETAMAAIRTKDSYLAAQYARLKPRRGHKKALGAVKHSIICIIWHMLTTGELYTDLGGDYFRKRDPERITKRLIAQLESLGHKVTLSRSYHKPPKVNDTSRPEQDFPVRRGRLSRPAKEEQLGAFGLILNTIAERALDHLKAVDRTDILPGFASSASTLPSASTLSS